MRRCCRDMVELEGISKVYRNGGETIALKEISLKIEESDFVCIMGPSGSGKTTLLNIIGLLITPSSGVYRFKGRDVGQLSDRERSRIRNEEIGFIFQAFNLLPDITVIENVELPLVYSKVRKKERRERAMRILEMMKLADKAMKYPDQLSGGEQQRVAIARSLVNSPSLILADEPTGNLDSKNGEMIMEIISWLNREKGVTIVLVTYNEKIASYAREVLTLEDGRLKM